MHSCDFKLIVVCNESMFNEMYISELQELYEQLFFFFINRGYVFSSYNSLLPNRFVYRFYDLIN